MVLGESYDDEAVEGEVVVAAVVEDVDVDAAAVVGDDAGDVELLAVDDDDAEFEMLEPEARDGVQPIVAVEPWMGILASDLGAAGEEGDGVGDCDGGGCDDDYDGGEEVDAIVYRQLVLVGVVEGGA